MESIRTLRRQIKDKQVARVLAMEPGRALDALVAEYVMGFHVEAWSVDPDEPPDYWYVPNSAVRKLDGAEPERVPNYSTALLPSMQVAERFRHWRMEARTDLGTVDAALINELGQEHWVRSCGSVPEAVCKAALVSLVEADVLIDKLLEE